MNPLLLNLFVAEDFQIVQLLHAHELTTADQPRGHGGDLCLLARLRTLLAVDVLHLVLHRSQDLQLRLRVLVASHSEQHLAIKSPVHVYRLDGVESVQHQLALLVDGKVLTIVDDAHHGARVAVHEHEVVELTGSHLLALLGKHHTLATVALHVELDAAVLHAVLVLVDVVLNPVTTTGTLSAKILSVTLDVATQIPIHIGIVQDQLQRVVEHRRSTQTRRENLTSDGNKRDHSGGSEKQPESALGGLLRTYDYSFARRSVLLRTTFTAMISCPSFTVLYVLGPLAASSVAFFSAVAPYV